MSIEISKLTKIYGQGSSAVVALNELDLKLGKNEICIVRGPNGSGKTTLISILSGELEATSGSISLSARDSQKPKISVVNQFNNLLDELTIKEHFEIFGNLENQDLVPAEILDRRPTEISRGQAQLAAIALTLSPDTDLLLADEPTGALGAQDSQLVYEFIRSAAVRNDSAVVLVTHDRNAEIIADRVVRLRDGRISEVWKQDESERQVINDRGWVKLPNTVLDGLDEHVQIAPTAEGANLIGRKSSPTVANEVSVKRSAGNHSLIEVRDLVTRYGVQVITENLNFVIADRELFCIFGKSGAGKSTLLKTICGLHKNFQGIISPVEPRPYFNIENLFGLELSLSEFEIAPNLIENLLLTEYSQRPLATLSGGQQQRALVAIALSAHGSVIVLDEPTTALDDEMAEVVIRTILASEKTIILATHDERLLPVANSTLRI